jgi:uncharacterized membrane protein
MGYVIRVMKCNYKIFLLLPLVFIVFVLSDSAKALTINPSKFTLTIDPGASQILPLTITNSSDTPRRFKLGVVGARQNEGGGPIFETNLDTAETWITPLDETELLLPRQSTTVQYTVDAPADAEPGSAHYLGLTVAPLRPLEGTVGIAAEAISLVEIQVAGFVEEKLKINSWSAKKQFSRDPNWQFDLRLENQGTVSLPLEANIVVKNWRGQELLNEPLLIGNRLISKAKRNLTPTLDISNYIKTAGPYQVKLRITYGKTKQVTENTALLWYFSEDLSSAIVGIIILFVIILFLIVRRTKKRRSKFKY